MSGRTWFMLVFNTRAVPIVAVVLHPAFGLLLDPIIASVAMIVSSIPVVIGNAFPKWRKPRLPGT